MVWREISQHDPVHQISDVRPEGIARFHVRSPRKWLSVFERSGSTGHDVTHYAKGVEGFKRERKFPNVVEIRGMRKK